MSLENICLVVDMDGFRIGKKFLPRELGYFSLTEDYGSSYRFRLNRFAKGLTAKDWQTINFCTRNLHGMAFFSPRWEKDLFWFEHLDQLVKNLYADSRKKNRYLVAYKGGHVEKDILDRLEIPSVNLEDYGCPKYDNLPEPEVKDCGYHRWMTKKPIHCPLKECHAFATWIKNELEE